MLSTEDTTSSTMELEQKKGYKIGQKIYINLHSALLFTINYYLLKIAPACLRNLNRNYIYTNHGIFICLHNKPPIPSVTMLQCDYMVTGE